MQIFIDTMKKTHVLFKKISITSCTRNDAVQLLNKMREKKYLTIMPKQLVYVSTLKDTIPAKHLQSLEKIGIKV